MAELGPKNLYPDMGMCAMFFAIHNSMYAKTSHLCQKTLKMEFSELNFALNKLLFNCLIGNFEKKNQKTLAAIF